MDCISRFNGMWALVTTGFGANCFTRDRFGIAAILRQ
jgi:hypothetical protein